MPFVEFLDKADVFVERGIERDLVPAIVHRDGEALVPVHLARDDFGVLVGRNFQISEMGAFGPSLCRSLTLHDALTKLRATLLPEGRCRLEQVAKALGMHPRSLQRKLSALGQDYSELLSQIRYEKTLRLIQEPGFQDASNIFRSFRQWTGVTPTEFRATQQSRH